MPSRSFLRWQNERVPRLDALGSQAAAAPTSTLADENLRALVAMLCAHFQGFCRDLYTEAAGLIAASVPPHLQAVVQRQTMADIKLGTGNPNLQTLSNDFNRFAMDLKALLDANPANTLRVNHLALLNKWRNYVVHHGASAPAGPPLSPAIAQAWQTSCGELAVELDRIMYDKLLALLGAPPW